MLSISGELIVSRYVAESMTTNRAGVCQLRTKQAYMAGTSCISCYWFCSVSAHDQIAPEYHGHIQYHSDRRSRMYTCHVRTHTYTCTIPIYSIRCGSTHTCTHYQAVMLMLQFMLTHSCCCSLTLRRAQNVVCEASCLRCIMVTSPLMMNASPHTTDCLRY